MDHDLRSHHAPDFMILPTRHIERIHLRTKNSTRWLVLARELASADARASRTVVATRVLPRHARFHWPGVQYKWRFRERSRNGEPAGGSPRTSSLTVRLSATGRRFCVSSESAHLIAASQSRFQLAAQQRPTDQRVTPCAKLQRSRMTCARTGLNAAYCESMGVCRGGSRSAPGQKIRQPKERLPSRCMVLYSTDGSGLPAVAKLVCWQ
jgi:hypothetical protein